MALTNSSPIATIPQAQVPNGPFVHAAPVTKSDTTVGFGSTSSISRGLYVGVTGDVAVVLAGDAIGAAADGVVFKAVPAGTVLPVCAKQVLSTGTTATNIVALW